MAHVCVLETIQQLDGSHRGRLYQCWADVSGVGDAGYTVEEWLSSSDSSFRATQNLEEPPL